MPDKNVKIEMARVESKILIRILFLEVAGLDAINDLDILDRIHETLLTVIALIDGKE